MPRPQAVIFDLGKVLLDFDYLRASHAIAARSKTQPGAIDQLINQSPLLLRYERGEMTTAEFFEAVRATTGFQGSLNDFGPLFGDIFSPIPLMIELQSTLRKNSVPTYIFSNTNHLAVTHISSHFPFFSQFDGYIYSYQHGSMKPDAKIYEVVEHETGLRGEQLIYVDDRAENIAGGISRGWQVVLYETPEKTIEAFKKAGLPL